MNSLKEVSAELMKRTQELQRQVHRYTMYLDFMEQAAKMTKVLGGFLHGSAT